MALFQGLDNIFWFWVEVIFSVISVVIIWFMVKTGRDRKPQKQRRGEETLERYGDIEEDRAPIPIYLILLYIGIGIWAVGYIVWTGVNGLGY